MNAVEKEEKLLFKWFRVRKNHHAVLEQALSFTGVYRSQHKILMCIADHPDISQKGLAEMNAVSTATIAVSLKKLEKGGYISRVADAEDNRYNQIRITEKGGNVVEESRRIIVEVEKAKFQVFTEVDLGQLEDFLD